MAIVTEGMGIPICQTLADEGAAVALAGREIEALEAQASKLRERLSRRCTRFRSGVT